MSAKARFHSLLSPVGAVGGEVDGSDVFPAASACSKVAIR